MTKGPALLLPALYLALFFAYLFGPLAIMAITAFNSAGFPRVSPWECLTFGWFGKLAQDTRLLEGIGNSLIIGVGVVLIAVPIGLAAALTLSQVGPRLRASLYTVFIAPILVPGVVIGLSTLIFWDRLGAMVGADYDTLFYDGIFLTIAGQVTFIAAYSMLVFLSRISRFDPTLTEAALDMGATPTQAFAKVLLPFMAPAIASAAVLAFLASMENYNTTVFTVVAESTFTTVLASKVRYGLDPSISAVAVIIVAFTLIAATVFEMGKRRQTRAASGLLALDRPVLKLIAHPLFVAGLMAALVGGVVWTGVNHDSSVCEMQVLDEKRAVQERLEQERRERLKALTPAPPAQSTPAQSTPAQSTPAQSTPGPSAPARSTPAPSSPGGAFAPGSLAPGSLAPGGSAPAPAPSAPGGPFAPGSLAPGGAFAPGGLAPSGSAAD